MDPSYAQEQRAHYHKMIKQAATDAWRARMHSQYWHWCRVIKAQRLGIKTHQLPFDDAGDCLDVVPPYDETAHYRCEG